MTAIIDVKQIVYALERARDRLDAEADKLHEQLDHGAEFPAEDADRMREAIALLQAKPAQEAAPTGPKLTTAEMRALGASVYNFGLMIGEMHAVEGVRPEQIERERAKLALAKRGLKKLRTTRAAPNEAPAP